MTELRNRFKDAEGIPVPDVWDEALRRAEDPAAQPPTPPRGRGTATVVGAAISLLATLILWRIVMSPGSDAPVVTPAPTASPSPAASQAPAWSDLPVGWSELPPPPEVRSGAATVWTERSLIVWGGYVFDGGDDSERADGFMFDAGSRRWTPLPPSPLRPRQDAATAWTGTEMLVWGGIDTSDSGIYNDDDGVAADGAAFDPVAGTWRMLPPAPLLGRIATAAWTGKELVIWSSSYQEGAAYDPSTNTWRSTAEPPIDLTRRSWNAVWTGREMIVFGAALDANNVAATPTAVGAAYDPVRDRWRRIADSPLSPQASTSAWVGDVMIAWDYLNAVAAYDPTTDTWRRLPRVPLEEVECPPYAIAVGEDLFGSYCGLLVALHGGAEHWSELGHLELAGKIIEPVAAGEEVVIVLTAEIGGDERRAFAYRFFD